MSNNQHAPWIRDEAAGVLALMKKDYMKGFKDCLTSLYDCKPYERKLRTSQRKDKQTEFIVNDPYLNLLWATTDASFAANTELNDALSGFLARFLFFFPQGRKPKFMPLREGNGTTSAFETVIVDQLRAIYDKINGMERTIMHLAPDATGYWNEWQEKREAEAIETNDGFSMQIFSRANPTVAKLVMLFEMGSPDFDPVKPISLPYIEEACRLIDDYLIPTARAMYDLVGSNAEKNVIDRIVGYLKNHNGKATKNDIARDVKIKSKELAEYIDTMLEYGMVRTEIYQKHGKGRDTLWLFLEDSKIANVSKIAKVSIIAKIDKTPLDECNIEAPSTLAILASLPILSIKDIKGGEGEDDNPSPTLGKIDRPTPERERFKAGHAAHRLRQDKHTCSRCGKHDDIPYIMHDYNGYYCEPCRRGDGPPAAPLQADPQTSLAEVQAT